MYRNEPPIDDFELQPEPESIDPDDYASALIEDQIESVEMRDAETHSARVERHRSNKTSGCRNSQSRDSYSDDHSSNNLGRGIFRYGFVITLGLAAISAIAILALFAVSHISHVPDISVEIKLRSTANDNYLSIQPKS